MRVRFAALWPAGCLFFALCLHSQTVVTPVSILSQANNAFSGNKAVQSIQLAGKVIRHAGSTDDTGTATLTAKATGESQVTFNFSAGTRSETTGALSSSPRCTWSEGDKINVSAPIHNCLNGVAWFLPSLTLQGQTFPTVTNNYVGKEDGGEHLRNQNTLPTKDPEGQIFLQRLGATEIYLDPATFLPASIQFNLHPDNDALTDIPIEVRFSDYRNINGVQVPFKIERYMSRTLVLDITIDSAVVTQ